MYISNERTGSLSSARRLSRKNARIPIPSGPQAVRLVVFIRSPGKANHGDYHHGEWPRQERFTVYGVDETDKHRQAHVSGRQTGALPTLNAIDLIAACARPHWVAASFMPENEVKTRFGGGCRTFAGCGGAKIPCFDHSGLLFRYEICLQSNADGRKQLLI